MMMQHYKRFYKALAGLPYSGDRDDLKMQLVSDHTNGRTTHLSDLTPNEYRLLCSVMESRVQLTDAARHMREELKRHRSIVLRLLTDYGVDTTSWTSVDAFCMQPKIAGKRFAWMKPEELEALERKMRAILAKRATH